MSWKDKIINTEVLLRISERNYIVDTSDYIVLLHDGLLRIF